jgi:hypothetical protein
MNEFYVGYLPIPPGVKRFAQRIVAALGAVAAGVAILLVFEQSPFAPASFEYRDYHDFEGVLVTNPYPALVAPGGTPWLLAGPGKRGFTPPSSLDGRVVRLRGERIVNGTDRMLEVDGGAVSDAGPGHVPAEINLGPTELTGEIVDSKCYFGVMNPGRGKVHRDCAARCISGGIPPALLVRDASGLTATVLIANFRRELLEQVAEPFTLRGRLTRSAGRLILYPE